MKTSTIVCALLFSVGAFAAPLKSVTCQLSNKTVVVPVTTGSVENERVVTLDFQNDIFYASKAEIMVRYNGTSAGLKPGASGNYTLQIYVTREGGEGGEAKQTASFTNWSTSFPTSGNVTYMSESNRSDDSEIFGLSFTCQ